MNNVVSVSEAESDSTTFFAFLMFFTAATIAIAVYGLPFVASFLR